MTTRDRILDVGAELFRRKGCAGTGLKEIAQKASAPFGSIYHFFPGGKDELIGAIIEKAGRSYSELIPITFDPEQDVARATKKFFMGAAQTLKDSTFADACPIATVALEVASTNETLRKATALVFDAWLAELEIRYAAAGIPKRRAAELARIVLCMLEGGFILCRSLQNTLALENAGSAAEALIKSETKPSRRQKS